MPAPRYNKYMDISLFDYAFAHQTHMIYGKQSKNVNYIRNEYSKDRITLKIDEWIYNDYWPVTNTPKADKESLADYALLLEPKQYKPNLTENIHSQLHKYKKVLTHNRELLESSDSFEYYPFGGCWIPEKLYNPSPEKDNLISFIFSDKKQLEGHKLRHEVNCMIHTDRLPVCTYGRGQSPSSFPAVQWNYPMELSKDYIGGKEVECKSEALERFMFSLVIENVRQDWWFTEKLLDCFALGVVPIYWGCPDIGRFFDTKGMIIVENINEIKQTIIDLTSSGKDIYKEKRESIDKNFELFKQYAITDDWLYHNIFKNHEL